MARKAFRIEFWEKRVEFLERKVTQIWEKLVEQTEKDTIEELRRDAAKERGDWQSVLTSTMFSGKMFPFGRVSDFTLELAEQYLADAKTKLQTVLSSPAPDWRKLPPGEDLNFEVACVLAEVWGYSWSIEGGIFPDYSRDISEILEVLNDLYRASGDISITLRHNYRFTSVATLHIDSPGLEANFTRLGRRWKGAFSHEHDRDTEEHWGEDHYEITPAMAIVRAFISASDWIRRLPEPPYPFSEYRERESYFDFSAAG